MFVVGILKIVAHDVFINMTYICCFELAIGSLRIIVCHIFGLNISDDLSHIYTAYG